MSRVIDKVIMDKARATIIVPVWQGQHWFKKTDKYSDTHPFTYHAGGTHSYTRVRGQNRTGTGAGRLQPGECMVP